MNDTNTPLEQRLRVQLTDAIDRASNDAPQTTVSVPAPASPRRVGLARPAVVTASVIMATAATAFGVQLMRASDPDENAPRTPQATEAVSETPLAPTDQDCPPFRPRQLLDGSKPGPTEVIEDDVYGWGTGDLAVHQASGTDPLELLYEHTESQAIPGDRVTAYATEVGDPGVGQIAFAFEHDGCKYTVWLPSGTTMAQAQDFIRNY